MSPHLPFGLHLQIVLTMNIRYVKTGSDHGVRVSSSWKRRNKNLTVSFTNQLGGQYVRMLLEGGRLHVRNDALSPVVAVIDGDRVRMAQGLDMSLACLVCAVRNESQEVKCGGSLRSVKGSFSRRWGK